MIPKDRSKMNNNLRRLISDVMVSDEDSNYTHHSYFGPQQRLRLKIGEQAVFWRTYCDIVSDINLSHKGMSLAEVIGENCPVIINFNLLFSGLDDTESAASNIFNFYKEDFIMSVVSCYQQSMIDNLELSESRTEIICCVLEPEENYSIEGQIRVSFKLQFPYCRTDTKFQNRILRPSVIKYLRQMNVMKLLEEQPDNDWEEILDKDSSINPWPMYRGTPDPRFPTYELTHIYGFITKEHIENPEEEGPEIELEKVFVPVNHSHVRDNLIRPELFESNELEHWLPLFLSINYWQVITHPKEHTSKVNVVVKKDIPDIQTPLKTVNTFDDEISDMDIAIELTSMLKPNRRDKEHFWIDVGKALFSACKGGMEGLDTWIEFTRDSGKFTEDDCKREYPGFVENNRITVKTIAWYAKEDDPKSYSKWHQKWCMVAMRLATSCTHTDVVTAMYRIYWLEFVCASISGKRWYQFENHRWKPTDKGIGLQKKMTRDFVGRFENYRTYISHEIQNSTDPDFKANAEILLKKISALIGKLKSITFKSTLMREAMEHFYVEFFDDYKDTNPNLMGIINGVVETKGVYAAVRSGKPEDYVTMCSPVYWQDDLNWEHPKVREFTDWMAKCFTDRELCGYFLRLMSSCLRSGNFDKIFPIFTGDGNNSKSMVKKIIEEVFGPYSYTFPNTFFTKNRGESGKASPELALAMRSKIAWMQETDDADTINGGTLKEMTGMDKTFARMMRENGGNFEVIFKLILMCNKIPSIPSADKAIKNRVAIVPFMSVWVDPKKKDNEYEVPEDEAEQMKMGIFKMDPTFSEKIPSMKSAALWVLVKTYSDYVKNGLKTPDAVNKATKHYWSENDMYTLFAEECISTAVKPGSITDTNPEGERDFEAKMTLTDVFAEFKYWYKETYPGSKPLARDTFKYELEQRWGKLPRGGWKGIRTKQTFASI